MTTTNDGVIVESAMHFIYLKRATGNREDPVETGECGVALLRMRRTAVGGRGLAGPSYCSPLLWDVIIIVGTLSYLPSAVVRPVTKPSCLVGRLSTTLTEKKKITEKKKKKKLLFREGISELYATMYSVGL